MRPFVWRAISGIRPALISVTIVAVGTSMPEAIVSVLAALKGNGDIAAANVVGSNIVNIGLVLGFTAIFRPIAAQVSSLKIDWPILFFSGLCLLWVVQDLVITRVESGFLLLGALLFTGFMIYFAKRDRKKAKEAAKDKGTPSIVSKEMWIDCAKMTGGFVLLFFGGNFVLDGAIGIAREFAITERIIGLTIVAIGTALPEIVTSVVAAMKKAHEVVLGNIIGSNIYNTFGVLGLAGLTNPTHVSAPIANFDIWFMLGFIVILLPIMYFFKGLPRWTGGILVAGLVCLYYDAACLMVSTISRNSSTRAVLRA